MTETPAITREIGGRRFREIQDSTLEHDIWMMRQAHQAGIDNLKPLSGEKREDFAVRIHWLVIESGRIFDILAGILIPEELTDSEWTAQVAAKTVGYLRNTTGAAAKKEAQSALIQFSAFFAAGMLYTDPSRTASAQASKAEYPRALLDEAVGARIS